jgi:TetR/AcrR family transcriptional repressor of nem operon
MITQGATMDLPETKRKLVDAGANLMRNMGFHATTVDDICAAAEVTKGAFFHYFKSKEDLAKAAIQRFSEVRLHDSEAAAFRKLSDPLDRVYGRLDYAEQMVGGKSHLTKGCLIGTMAQEVSFTNPNLRTVCQNAFLRMAGDFEVDLAAAKALYAPQGDFDPKSLALFYVSIFQGSSMMAKASESNQVLQENIEQFRRYLRYLFGQSKEALTPSARPVA